jgi:uncharacterized membrane protein YfcA
LNPFLAHSLLGLFAGAYGTIIGAGGGSLIVPALLLLFHYDLHVVVGTSLCAVFANAASGTLSYARQGRIDTRNGLLFALTVIPGALLGAWLAHWISLRAFGALFGLLMASLGILVLRQKENPLLGLEERSKISRGYFKLKLKLSRVRDREGQRYEYFVDTRLGMAVSFAAGCLSSLLGIGGGILHVPAMILWLGFPKHLAVATSHFVLAISSLAGVLLFAWQGSIAWAGALPLALGAVAGAQVGAALSRKLSGQWLSRMLSTGLLLVGLRMLVVALIGR